MGRDNRPSLVELRAEMARLTAILLDKNRQYMQREADLKAWHDKEIKLGRNPGNLISVMRNDLTLADLSGAAKTCAALAGALAEVMQAELAWRRFHATPPPVAGPTATPWRTPPRAGADRTTETIQPSWATAETQAMPRVMSEAERKAVVRADLANRYPHLIPQAEQLGMI